MRVGRVANESQTNKSVASIILTGRPAGWRRVGRAANKHKTQKRKASHPLYPTCWVKAGRSGGKQITDKQKYRTDYVTGRPAGWRRVGRVANKQITDKQKRRSHYTYKQACCVKAGMSGGWEPICLSRVSQRKCWGLRVLLDTHCRKRVRKLLWQFAWLFAGVGRWINIVRTSNTATWKQGEAITEQQPTELLFGRHYTQRLPRSLGMNSPWHLSGLL